MFNDIEWHTVACCISTERVIFHHIHMDGAAGGQIGDDVGALAAVAAAVAFLVGSGKAAGALASMPATGWPFFLGIGFAYFVLSFLLLGAVFRGIGRLPGPAPDICPPAV